MTGAFESVRISTGSTQQDATGHTPIQTIGSIEGLILTVTI